MRQFQVKDPYRKRTVTIWARDVDTEPRYLEIPTGSTVWVEVGKAGPLAAPCEYRPGHGEPVYSAMVSLEDIGLRAVDPILAKRGGSGAARSSSKGGGV